ncbi:uncharacterized protein LOC126554050 [Aphis gossypii]|uniref:uncharacterized protein LOC126551931 n=1 Tax=Aphis gossypii TaxID=80765 RepID=UPI002158A6C6|nr:uncharacterized protein LOC126551931 [Aphis gossypii]XP_050062380.1 uncharacterized protein LOC126551991 [Aphis gossypii]XP_050062381.1 uncharacterized protein LOC126551992 [Aphis gossypii]XP_050064853.1 uncharacterized protein LOC126553780 [Aphis gossypii]XP_050065120.1 uncharacterized protein LOC126554050 [Aphis gossypii]
MLLFLRRSFSVKLSASSDFLCAIVHSSQTMSLHCINNFPIALDREILHVGVSIVFKLSGNLSAECAVRPPSRRVAAIPDDANAKAMSHLDRIVAKINEMTNVFPVPPGASRKNRPPVLLSTACINVLYTCFCCSFSNGTLFLTNSCNVSTLYCSSRFNSWLNASCIDRFGAIIPTSIIP